MKPAARLALLSLAFAAPAFAQTQAELNAHEAQQAKAADRALNTQYTVTMARLSAPSRLLLRDAQRSWIVFRDQQCKFESSGVIGGSAYPMIYAACLTHMSNDRTRELRVYAQCEEGDLSCPG
jgi:uncharacterized protein YecT (DUF1311 family)